MPRRFFTLAVGLGVGLTLAVIAHQWISLARANIPPGQIPGIILRQTLNDLKFWGPIPGPNKMQDEGKRLVERL